MLKARALEVMDLNSLPNFPPPSLFATGIAARLALLTLNPGALESDPEAVPRRIPKGDLLDGTSSRTIAANDPIAVLEAVAAGCRVRPTNPPVGIDPEAIDPETVERALGILKVPHGLKEDLEDLYTRGDRYCVWVDTVECPRCGLRIPAIDDPWVVPGEYLLEPEVDGETVSFRVVRTRDHDGGTPHRPRLDRRVSRPRGEGGRVDRAARVPERPDPGVFPTVDRCPAGGRPGGTESRSRIRPPW